MKKLVALANKVKQLSVNDLIHELSENNSFTDFIIELNTKKQLYDKGVDSNDKTLGEYSSKTKGIKQQKGERFDHITLLDTGKFYESFKVYLNSQSDFIISADTVKDTSDLITDYGKDILGLNLESLSLLRERAIDILIPYVRKTLQVN
jgi:predicted transcriptional regulator